MEGDTERAFQRPIMEFVHSKLGSGGDRPRFEWKPSSGRIEKGELLRRRVRNHLSGGASHVVALTDVYTGSRDFSSAADAIAKMRAWVPDEEERFHPHAAQYEVEAWLLPYWDRIVSLAKSKAEKPATPPEQVNHQTPPSKLLDEVFLKGAKKSRYLKVRDTAAILRNADLSISINVCPNFKAFMNTLLRLSGANELP